MPAASRSLLRQLARPVVMAASWNRAFDPRRAARTLGNLPRFVADYAKFRAMSTRPTLIPRLAEVVPIVLDRTENSGAAGGDYFWQDLWAAKKIYVRRPARHLDVGSRVDGFVAHLLVFMPVEVIDVRPLASHVPGLTFRQADATDLSNIPDDSADSISCLHAAEHFGLGRYGDPLDPEGCFRAMRALARVLRPEGRLYFSVPIGRERVEFNAHRILSPTTVINEMSSLELVEFSAVDLNGRLQTNARVADYEDVVCACGLFEFTKKASAQ